MKKDFDIEEIMEESDAISTVLTKRKETYKSVKIENATVHFISPSEADHFVEMSKFQKKFDIIFLSVQNANFLNKNIKNCMSTESVVLVETTKFVLDLKKEQMKDHLNTGVYFIYSYIFKYLS